MRYEEAHKAKARKAILRGAARRIRKNGIADLGVRGVMADAGLTHGAFYAHFRSRSDLVAQTIASAMDDAFSSLEKAARAAPHGTALETLIGTYLSAEHRDHPERGCVFASLLPETLREDAATRGIVAQGVLRVEALIADNLPAGGAAEGRRERARMMFSGMMGALQISRLFVGETRSDEALAQGQVAALALARQPWPDR